MSQGAPVQSAPIRVTVPGDAEIPDYVRELEEAAGYLPREQRLELRRAWALGAKAHEGQFRKSVQSGQGWHGYELFSGTDFNGDGIADLLSRDSKGQVHFYAGKGAAAFRTAVKVGTGW